MRLILCLACCGLILFSSSQVLGQANEELIRVRTGQGANVLRTFPKNKRFRFATFEEGRIFNSEKAIWTVHRINYDLLLGEMLTINDNGDTVLIDDNLSLRYFVLHDTAFVHIYGKGYFEFINGNDSVRLCSRQVYTMKRRERHLNNGYGDFNDQTSAYTSWVYQSANGAGLTYDYNGDVMLRRSNLMYLMDGQENIYKASKANFIKIFPSLKREINDYVRDNNVNFQSRKQIEDMFTYCLSTAQLKMNAQGFRVKV